MRSRSRTLDLTARRSARHAVVRAAHLEVLEPRRLFAVTGAGTGTGLTAQFFNTTSLTGSNPVLTRTDAQVNFNWGTGSPGGGVSASTFAARWSGAVQAQRDEVYTFFVSGDDGYRLWVNDQLIINNWTTQTAAVESSGQIALRAGQVYPIRLEYFDSTGTAQVSLSWSSPGTPKALVPTSQLYTTFTAVDRGSALAEVWENFNGRFVSSLRTNAGFLAGTSPSFREPLNTLESPQQDWGFNTATKVRGYIVPDVTGTYRLAISGSSDAQLNLNTTGGTANTAARRVAYTNGATAFRAFTASSVQQSAAVTLTAGVPYYFEVWAKAGETSNHFSVAWQTPWAASSWTVIDGAFLMPVGTTTQAPSIPATGPFTNLFANMSTGRSRILATAQDWARANALIAQGGQFATWRNNITALADTHLDDTALVYNASTTQSMLQDLERDLTSLAAAWKFTGNDAYAAKAWEKMTQALAWTNWDGGGQGLGIGMGAQGMAVAYDWLFPWIESNVDPVDVQTMKSNVNRVIITPVVNTLRAGNYWVPWQNNWAFVVAGGAISAALAIAPDFSAESSELIARAIPRFNLVIDRTMGVNAGGSDEGPGYNTYGGTYLVKALAAMTNVLGTDFGMSRTDGFSQWANFMFAQYANNDGNAMAMFSEGQWTQIFEPWNFYFATRFARSDVAWWIRTKQQSNSTDPLYLLWYDARGSTPANTAMRTEWASVGDESNWHSEEVYTTRTTWADPAWDAPTLFFKGGIADNRHDLLDAGTWNYDSQGKRWFPVIYHSDYGLPGYGTTTNINTVHPNRWDYYANRAEAKNTLVINGNSYSGPDQVPGSNNTVIRSLSTGSESTSIVDLTPAYATLNGVNQVSRLWRGFRLDKRTGVATIQDEITPATGVTLSTVDWFATYNQNDGPAPVFSNGNRDVMFSQGSARLYMRIISPAAASFSIVDARSLWTGPGSSFLNPANDINYAASYDRLTIRLTNVSAPTTLTVAVWGNWGTATPPFPTTTTALSGWAPRQDVQAHLGDIDGFRPGDTADATSSTASDATWRSQISVSTGRTAAGFDHETPNRVVPLTFNYAPVGATDSITGAKLVMSVRNVNNSTSGSDLLFINSTSGGIPLSTAFSGHTIGSTPTTVEYNLSAYLTAMKSGKLNLALSGNTAVDWAYISFDRTGTASAPIAPASPGVTTSPTKSAATLSPLTASTTSLSKAFSTVGVTLDLRSRNPVAEVLGEAVAGPVFVEAATPQNWPAR